MLIFDKMMGFGLECKNHKEDTNEYKRCIKQQALANQLFQKFKQENQELLENFSKLIDEDSNKKLIMALYYIYSKIDASVDLDEQERVLNELFSSLVDMDNHEFDF